MPTLTIFTAPANISQPDTGAVAATPYGLLLMLDKGDGSPPEFYGFAPAPPNHAAGQGQVTRNDMQAYADLNYGRTITINEEQYNKLRDFGQNPEKYGFNTNYLAIGNNCNDFVWNALDSAGIAQKPDGAPPTPLLNQPLFDDALDKFINAHPELPNQRSDNEYQFDDQGRVIGFTDGSGDSGSYTYAPDGTFAAAI